MVTPPPKTDAADDSRLDELIRIYLEQVDQGETPDIEELADGQPELIARLKEFAEAAAWIERMAGPTLEATQASIGTKRELRRDASIADTQSASSADPTPVPILTGRFGRYEIDRVIGQGGMGRVYLAHDTELGRPVALKVPQLSDSSGLAAERFLREARSAAQLRHPNICPVFDVGQIDGHRYLTMAFIQGETLADHVRRRGPLPIPEAIRLTRTLAEAVGEAHQRGIIHRDLKPGNVMIDERNEPIVMDFGLARALDSVEPLTDEGVVLGSPAYMSTEQMEGKNEQVGPPTDVYALGALLYYLLTGRPPFVGNLSALAAQTLFVEAEPPSQHQAGICEEIDRVVLKMLAKRPADRYPGMVEVAQALDEASAEPLPEPVAEVSWARRRSGLLTATAAGLLGVLVLLGIVINIEWGDGKKVTLDVPAGSRLTVDAENRTVEVRPQDPQPAGAPDKPNASPVAFSETLPDGPDTYLPGLLPEPQPIAGIGRWQIETRSPRERVTCTAVSSQGLIALGTNAGSIHLCDPKTLETQRILLGHRAEVFSVAFSPDGTKLASCAFSGRVLIRHINGRMIGEYQENWQSRLAVTWHPTEELVTIFINGRLVLCRESGETVLDKRVSGWSSDIALTWSPDGKWLACKPSFSSSEILLVSRHGDLGPKLTREGDTMWNAVWLPDSSGLLTLSMKGRPFGGGPTTLCEWSLEDGHVRSITVDESERHGLALNTETMEVMVGCGTGGVYQKDILIWPLGSFEEKRIVPTPLLAGRIHPVPNASFVLCSGEPKAWDDPVSLVNVNSLAHVNAVSDMPPLSMPLAYPGMPISATNGDESDMNGSGPGRVWTLSDDGALIKTISPPGRALIDKIAPRPGHDTWAVSLSLDPTDGVIQLWRNDGTPLGAFGPMVTPKSMIWSPDGEWLAVGIPDEEDSVQLYRADGTAGPKLSVPGSLETPIMCWHPSSQLIAIGRHGSRPELRIWDIEGNQLDHMEGPSDLPINTLSWNHDGTMIASGTEKCVQAWHWDGKLQNAWSNFEQLGTARSVDWNPSGQSIVMVDLLGGMTVYDREGAVIQRIYHTGMTTSSYFAPQRQELITSSRAGTILCRDANTLAHKWTTVFLDPDNAITLGPNGEILTDKNDRADDALVYIVEQSDGSQDMLTAKEFRERVASASP